MAVSNAYLRGQAAGPILLGQELRRNSPIPMTVSLPTLACSMLFAAAIGFYIGSFITM